MKNVIINEAAIETSAQVTNIDRDYIDFIAILQTADERNRNGRIYPKHVLENAIRSEYIQERLANGGIPGEAGHPLDQNIRRQMYIDQRNISHLILDLWWEGNDLKAKIRTAKTAAGKDLKGLIESGYRPSFSLRAQGRVERDASGNIVVQEPIKICTWDWVINPSHKRAFMENLCENAYTNYTTQLLMEGEDGEPKLIYDYENEHIHENLYNDGRIIEIEETQNTDSSTDEPDPLDIEFEKKNGHKPIEDKKEDKVQKEAMKPDGSPVDNNQKTEDGEEEILVEKCPNKKKKDKKKEIYKNIVEDTIEINYLPYTHRTVKRKKDLYVHTEGHNRVIDPKDKIVTVIDGNIIKKVSLNEYVTKDIRYGIANLLSDDE